MLPCSDVSGNYQTYLSRPAGSFDSGRWTIHACITATHTPQQYPSVLRVCVHASVVLIHT
jgi:hypothetical protein